MRDSTLSQLSAFREGYFMRLLLLTVGLLLAPWWLSRLLPRIVNTRGDRLLEQAPELKEFPPDKRGEVWLNAIAKALLRWPTVIVLPCAVALISSASLFLAQYLNNKYIGWGIGGCLFSALIHYTREPIVRHARNYLMQGNKINNNSR